MLEQLLRKRRQPRVDKLDYYSLDAYEAKAGKKVPAFKQAPMLDADVASGALPPVEKRLPVREDVQVVVPRESIGRYGGTISYNATNPNSFGNIGWSAQDVHLTGLTTNWEEVFPDLAKSVELSPDNTVATVKLETRPALERRRATHGRRRHILVQGHRLQSGIAAACRRSSWSAASR